MPTIVGAENKVLIFRVHRFGGRKERRQVLALVGHVMIVTEEKNVREWKERGLFYTGWQGQLL